MNINDLPVVTKPLLARCAAVSTTRIDTALNTLEVQGQLKRSKSPTGREILTPRQGQLVLDAICCA